MLVSQHNCYDSSAWPWDRMGVLASVGMGVERGKEGGGGGSSHEEHVEIMYVFYLSWVTRCEM